MPASDPPRPASSGTDQGSAGSQLPGPEPLDLAYHHVLLPIPVGSDDHCRAFYCGILGMTEVPKPPALAARGGLWLRSGSLELHLGVDVDFRPLRKPHPGILVGELDVLADRITRAGIEIRWDSDFLGMRRFYVDDPVGNRLEFLQPARPPTMGTPDA